MPKSTLILLVFIAILLASCQGQGPTVPTAIAPTLATQTTATRAAVAATATEAIEQSLAEAPPGCTVISQQDTSSPTEESIFPAVTDKDWAIGPKDAAITLIEYSDFQ
jgi:hypothetical protein